MTDLFKTAFSKHEPGSHIKKAQRQLLYWITFVGSASSYLFGGIHILDGDTALGTFEVVVATLAVINAVLFPIHHRFLLAANIILVLMVVMLDALILTGGIKRTGAFWIFTFPLLTFFLGGPGRAVVWNIMLWGSISVLLVLDAWGMVTIAYTFVEIRQLFSAYLAVFLIAFFYSRVIAQLNEELWETSIRDPLTGLYNRAYMEENLRLELERLERGVLRSLCLVYLDLDNFKYVNDHYGHQKGDEVLIAVAHLFQSHFRKTDIIGRIGGDEFLLLLDSCDVKAVEGRLESLRQIVERNFKPYRLSMSYGIVRLPDEAEDMERALTLADEKMYRVKRRKKASHVHSWG